MRLTNCNSVAQCYEKDTEIDMLHKVWTFYIIFKKQLYVEKEMIEKSENVDNVSICIVRLWTASP